MSDPTVEKWKQKGQIWIWRYPGRSKHYEGLHFTADSVACKSLKDLFHIMKVAKWPSTKVLRISKKEFIDTTGNNIRLSVIETLKLKYRKGLISGDHWHMEWDSNRKNYILTIGEEKLNEIDKGIVDITKGYGDYAIGPKNNKEWDQMCLWFWWHVNIKNK